MTLLLGTSATLDQSNLIVSETKESYDTDDRYQAGDRAASRRRPEHPRSRQRTPGLFTIQSRQFRTTARSTSIAAPADRVLRGGGRTALWPQ
jgi:hypothetical protein